MTQQLSEKINDLEDRKAIRILEFYAARLFEGIQTSRRKCWMGFRLNSKRKRLLSTY
jgi:hypothetical protein